MGQNPRSRTRFVMRSVRLPAYEAVPRTRDRYRVVGLRIDGEFDIGITVAPDDDGTIDKFPQTVHDILPEMADGAVDVHRLRDETTAEHWPVFGRLTLSRESGDTVRVAVEWLPPYLLDRSVDTG